MRNLLLTLTFVFAGLISLGVGPVLAAEGMSKQVALNQLREPIEKKSPQTVRPQNSTRVAYCGQCATDADCDAGYKCVGPRVCRSCEKTP